MVTELARYTPRPANRRAHALALLLLLAGGALFAVSLALPAYGGVVQIASLLLVVAGLFIAYKFLFSTYTYSIADVGDGELRLLVEQTQGRRSSLVCQFPLYAVCRVVEAGKERLPGKAYSYVATMHGGRYQHVQARIDGNLLLLQMEADEPFVALLREQVPLARQRRAEE